MNGGEIEESLDQAFYSNHLGQQYRLEFVLDSAFTPVTHGKILECTSKYNITIPLLKISRIVLIISRNEQFYSVSCSIVKDKRVLTYFVIYDDDFTEIFPNQDCFNKNLSKILKYARIDINSI